MTRTEAAHTNGALSHGPATAEGKARSSQNARKHGLSAAQVVAPGEDQAGFDDLCESLQCDYVPATAREEDLVSEIAAGRWRLRRAVVMEKAVIQIEMERVQNDKDHPCADPEFAAAQAWAAIAVSPGMKQIHRHETRLRRSCEKAAKELDLIQSDRFRFEQFVEQQEQLRRNEAEQQQQLEARNRRHQAHKAAAKRALQKSARPVIHSPQPVVQNEPVVQPAAPASRIAAGASEVLKLAA